MPFNTSADTSSVAAGLFLSDISSQDKPWDKHRSSAVGVAKLYSEGEYECYAERINQCSRQLGFVLALDENNPLQLRFKLNSAFFCRVRHCPVCQWRRSMMWRARMFQMLPRLLEAYPKHRYVFLTLTVRNVPLMELRETVQKINQAWGRLTKRKAFPGQGWIKSVEVTRNSSDDTVHPHIHALMMVGPSYFSKGYLSQAKWTELWKQCLRVDYQPIVNVKAVKPKPGVTDPLNGMAAAILETAKYAVKPEDLLGKKHKGDEQLSNSRWLQELTHQMHKLRSLAVGGVFKEFMSDEEPEDLIGSNDEDNGDKTSDVFFGWHEKYNRYRYED